MKQLYCNAIVHGGDHISIALGNSERLLKQKPNDLAALAYKGSLLILMSETMSLRQSALYLQNGIAIMQEVYAQLDQCAPDKAEAYVVAVTSLLRSLDPKGMPLIPTEALDVLLEPKRLSLLTDFEAVTVLVLAANIATAKTDRKAAHHFLTQALGISVSLTVLLRARKGQLVPRESF